jgi:hypothetical protein
MSFFFRMASRRSRTQDVDLFGHRPKRRRSRIESALLASDRETLADRLARCHIVRKLIPKGYGYMLPPESAFVFEEARCCFIDGTFVATILLCQAFIEHTLQSYFAGRCDGHLATAGLAKMSRHLRRHNLLHEFLLGKIDKLREIRNSFMHLQPRESPNRITRRSVERIQEPHKLLSQDAEFALALMYEVAFTRL